MERITLEQVGAVAVAVIDTPPGHAPDAAGRRSLIRLAGDVAADGGIRALVLLSTGTCPDPDMASGDPATDDSLAAVCDALDRLAIPVVAGLRGQVLGGGADLALAAHFRLAEADVTIGWPDIRHGRLGGGGGIQRLTRIAGAGQALPCLLTGEPVPAETAQDAGIVDGIVQGDLVEAAVALAGRLAEADAGARRSRDRTEGLDDTAAFHAATAAARKARALEAGSAEAAVVDCVEAALVLPFEAAVGFEIAQAEAVNRSGRSKALGHMRRAEQAAALPALRSAGRLARIGVQGGGVLAADLSHRLLAAGRTVVLSDPDPDVLRAGLSHIGSCLTAEAGAGRLDAAARADRLERLSSSRRSADLADCDLALVGAGGGRPAARAPLLALLSEGVFAPTEPPETLVGSGAFGLYLCSPAGVHRMAEMLPPRGARPAEVAALRDLMNDAGYQIVVTAEGAGAPIIARLSAALLAACEHLLEDGAPPRRIDRSLEAAGYACGPFRMLDRVGIEPLCRARRARAARRNPRERYVVVLERLCAAGRTGVASGSGFYDYPQGVPEGVPSGEVEALVSAARAEAGVEARELDADEIVRRCRLALTLEGVRLLADGTARQSSDIDVAAVHGLGYPERGGGPMFEAGRDGLERLREAARDLSLGEDAVFWEVPAHLDRLIAARPAGQHGRISRE